MTESLSHRCSSCRQHTPFRSSRSGRLLHVDGLGAVWREEPRAASGARGDRGVKTPASPKFSVSAPKAFNSETKRSSCARVGEAIGSHERSSTPDLHRATSDRLLDRAGDGIPNRIQCFTIGQPLEVDEDGRSDRLEMP